MKTTFLKATDKLGESQKSKSDITTRIKQN